MDYDVIGDIHGQADKLQALLRHLGYREKDGAYRHPSRTAIFVGDFIDRGPGQVESVMTVRRMVDQGTALAVMGNHEFNAIAWHTPKNDGSGDFLRTRLGDLGARNRAQHGAFLSQIESQPQLHKEIVDWFLTLPLWLDLPGIRVVHACWHDGYMAELKHRLNPNATLDRDLMIPASCPGAMEFRTVEGLTKGIEVPLPMGYMFHDKDGYTRQNVRIKWWDASGTTYKDLAMMSEDLKRDLPEISIPLGVKPIAESTKPIFFGHYWMTGLPELQSETAACVDYSAAKDGPLVAYRWSGETTLSSKNFSLVG